MKTVIFNNRAITLASAKEYSSENLKKFRLTISPKANIVFLFMADEEE